MFLISDADFRDYFAFINFVMDCWRRARLFSNRPAAMPRSLSTGGEFIFGVGAFHFVEFVLRLFTCSRPGLNCFASRENFVVDQLSRIFSLSESGYLPSTAYLAFWD